MAVSVAVIVWLPAVFSVTLNVPTPPVNVVLAGSDCRASLLVKWTVPRVAGGRVVERVSRGDRDDEGAARGGGCSGADQRSAWPRPR